MLDVFLISFILSFPPVFPTLSSPCLFHYFGVGKCSRYLLLSICSDIAYLECCCWDISLSLNNSPKFGLTEKYSLRQAEIGLCWQIVFHLNVQITFLSALVRDSKSSLHLGMNLSIKSNCVREKTWNNQTISVSRLLGMQVSMIPVQRGYLNCICQNTMWRFSCQASFTWYCQFLLNILINMLSGNQLVSLWSYLNVGTHQCGKAKKGHKLSLSSYQQGWFHLIWRCQAPGSGRCWK